MNRSEHGNGPAGSDSGTLAPHPAPDVSQMTWSPRRIALVTDAWHPQINGVVNTLARVVRYLESQGVVVLVLAPDAHRTVPMPGYREIRLACDPWNAVRRLREFRPDAVHIASEGPLGLTVRAWLARRRFQFTTSFHTRFPEYLSARVPLVPLSWGSHVERWFHAHATHTLVGTLSLIRELERQRVGRRLVHWPRGVDAELFHPSKRREDLYPWPRPIWLYVGRVAVEKSLDEFLGLSLPGTKVVVGDGPDRADLAARFQDVVWCGWRRGEDLAAHFASADCFVFPSRTESFGNVLLEAMASGLPVAAVPAPGPVDLIDPGVTGALGDDLAAACAVAVRCAGGAARLAALRYRWEAAHEIFLRHLVPMVGGAPVSDAAKALAAIAFHV